MVIAIMAVVINVISLLLLQRAPDTNVTLVVRSVNYLVDERAGYWKDHEESSPQLLHHLTYNYENIPALGGMDRFDGLLKIETEKSYVLTRVQKTSRATAILKMMAVITMAMILLIVISYLTGPIVTVTEKENTENFEKEIFYFRIE